MLCDPAQARRPGHHEARGFFGWFNRSFERGVQGYERGVRAILTRKAPYLLLYVVILGVMAWMFTLIPTAFLPRKTRACCSPR